ncbi:hypothetical protein UFOVP449_202 [uncultured Caudovirales phage]|uniref:Uncharacterized protein n=1 Tax=uncultured Caudovirales phage TaxID=2100421 RepID=A0A6J5MDQ5_9CAUD|nr:hypothetical protein UFOVP449_202 [uncultured Caudovirales phage]
MQLSNSVTVGYDPYLTVPQTVVLPLHYIHHISGESEIRTHGTFTSDGFQDRCTKPLYDLSKVTAKGLEPLQTESKSVVLAITPSGNMCGPTRIRTGDCRMQIYCVSIYTIGPKVEMARIELATSWSQTRRDNRATLHLELRSEQDSNLCNRGCSSAPKFTQPSDHFNIRFYYSTPDRKLDL